MILWQLFANFFMIGCLAFGGGYVMIPLIDSQIVQKLQWLSANEFANVVAIAEMTPGPIAINSATYVGFKMAGVIGSITATLGVLTPSFILVLLLAKIVAALGDSPKLNAALSGIRPVVVGMIASAVWSFGSKTLLDLRSWIVALVALVLLVKTKINPIWLIAISGVIGLVLF